MTERDVQKAEQEVQESTQEFERSMDHLEEAVEDAGSRVSRAVGAFVDTISKPKRIARDLRARARRTAVMGRDSALRYTQLAREKVRYSAQPIVRSVRQRPDVFGGVAAALVVLAVAGLALGRRRSRAREGGCYA